MASLYTSSPFLFVVEDSVYFVHAKLIATASRVFDRMINANFQEKEQGFVILYGVDKATFDRFLQWLYQGSYNAPEPLAQLVNTRRQTKAANDESRASEEGDQDKRHKQVASRVESRSCKVQKRVAAQKASTAKKVKNSLKHQFVNRESVVRQTVMAFRKPMPNLNMTADYTDVFLCHARLYTFAEERDVQALRLRALEALHAELAVFQLYECRIGDIVTLIGFVYDHTHFEGDDLRKMMIDYMAVEAETLSKSAEFKDLITDIGPPLLDDFLGAMGKKMMEGV